MTPPALLHLLLLLIFYQFKHWLADYPLQTDFMLGKFKEKGWVEPLAAHAGVHALITEGIVLLYLLTAAPWMPFLSRAALVCGLGLFDFVCHFGMDRIKASPNLMGQWKALSAAEYQRARADLAVKNPGSYVEELQAVHSRSRLEGNRLFWWAIGFDQMVHHLTHYVIIAILVTR